MAEIIDIQIHPSLGNLNDVVRQIQSRLSNIHAPVRVTVDDSGVKSLSGLDNKIRGIRREFDLMTDATTGAAISMQKFGEQSALAIKRFSAFTVVTSGFIGLTSAIVQSTRSAIAFNKEMVRISQVTGEPLSVLGNLRDEIERLSTGLGVSSAKLLNSAQVLAQAGLSAEDVRISLEALAKSDLSPTFEDITQTTEGAIAIFSQFKIQAEELEATLGSINAVSAKFAVESGDIISAVRRTGGAFAAAGGSLNELIALFTSVRATTRESAETISTGFRTIFTRLQRVSTQNALSTLGIQLQDLEGQFVGPFEAIRRISAALSELRSTDPRFSQVVEELGGFRQVSKVIPLIQEFGTAQRALAVAQAGQTSLSEDAVTAQQSLANQISKTKEQFAALIRTIAESDTFRGSIDAVLRLAQALLKLGESLVPILPALAALAAFKFGTNIKAFAQGFGPAIKPGGVSKFATGGLVPGTGNRDTVPAYLTPGEFVVRKDAVKTIGAENLQTLNKGGMVAVQKLAIGGQANNLLSVSASKAGAAPKANISATEGIRQFNEELFKTVDIATLFLNPGQPGAKDEVRDVSIEVPEISKLFNTKLTRPGAQLPELKRELPSGRNINKKLGIRIYSGTIERTGDVAKQIKDITKSNMISAINSSAELIGGQLGLPVAKFDNPAQVAKFNVESVTGNIFEGALNAIGAPFKPEGSSQDTFDFPKGIGPQLASKFFEKGPAGVGSLPADAKSTFGSDTLGSLTKKVKNLFVQKAKDLVQTSTVLNPDAIDKNSQNIVKAVNDKLTLNNILSLPTTAKGNINIKDIRQLIGTTKAGKIPQEEQQIIQTKMKEFGYSFNGLQFEPKKKADGGPIYAEKKGNKVPVMLTPGEFVFDKQTADRLGSSTLNSLNKGIVPGTGNSDTVPANLDAGQYVLNKKATQKLRTGGYVGVQHLQSGGSTGFGTTGLVGLAAIGTFANSFTDANSEVNKLVNTITGAVAQFSLLSAVSSELKNSFQQQIEARKKSKEEAEQNLTLKNKEESDIAQQKASAELTLKRLTQQASPQGNVGAIDLVKQKIDTIQKDISTKLQSRTGFTKAGSQEEANLIKAQKQLANLTNKAKETSKSIETLSKNLEAAKVSSQEAAKRVASLNQTFGQRLKATAKEQGGALAAAGLGAAGGFISDFANKRIEAGQDATGLATVGGGLSGAASGAAVGLAFGPQGAVIGGIIGGLAGLVTAFNEAQDQLKFNVAKKEIDELGRTLERVNKGQLTAFSSSGVIARQLEAGIGSLFTISDADKRKGIQAQLSGNVPAVEQFLSSLAKTSRTLDDFKRSAGSTIRSLSILSGIPFNELISSYEKQISVQNKQADLTALANKEFEKLNNQARLLSDVLAAVSSAKLATDNSNLSIQIPQLEAFASGRVGESRLRDTAGVIGSSQPVLDKTLFTGALDAFSVNVGADIAKPIRDELEQLNLAKSIVPNLLSAVQAKGFFDPTEGSLIDRGKQSLQDSGLAPEIQKRLLAGLEGEIGDAPDKFLQKLTSSRKLVEQELLKNLQYTAEEAGKIASLITEQTNKYVTGLDKARQLELAARDKTIKAIDLREQAAIAQAEFGGGSLSTQARGVFDEQRLAEVLRGTGIGTQVSPEQLLERLSQAQARLVQKEQDNTPERNRADVEKAIQDEKKTIESITKALEFFGDATARNAKLQDELSKRRQTREAFRGFAETATFGSTSDKLSLARNLSGAIALSRTNDINTIAPELRGGILNVLKQLGSTPLKGLGGRSGKDVIEATIRNDAIAQLGPKLGNEIADAIIKGAGEEKKLQEQVIANLERAATSMEGLAKNQEKNVGSLIDSLNKNFQSFFDRLDKNLLQTQKDKLVSEQTATEETQKGQQESAKRLVDIQDILGRVGGPTLGLQNGVAADKESAAVAAQTLQSLRGQVDNIKALADLTEQQRKVDLGKQGGLGIGTQFSGSIDLSDPQLVDKQLELVSAVQNRFGNLISPEKINELIQKSKSKRTEVDSQAQNNLAGAEFGAGLKEVETFDFDLFQKNLQAALSDPNITNNLTQQRAKLTTDIKGVFGKGVNIDALINSINELGPKLNVSFDSQNKAIVPLTTELTKTHKKLGELNISIGDLNTKLGITPKNSSFDNQTGNFIPTGKFATGGRVPGSGTRDTVPAMLTPGELVVPKGIAESRDTKKLLGFAGRHGFATGGQVSPFDSSVSFSDFLKRQRERRLEENTRNAELKFGAETRQKEIDNFNNRRSPYGLIRQTEATRKLTGAESGQQAAIPQTIPTQQKGVGHVVYQNSALAFAANTRQATDAEQKTARERTATQVSNRQIKSNRPAEIEFQIRVDKLADRILESKGITGGVVDALPQVVKAAREEAIRRIGFTSQAKQTVDAGQFFGRNAAKGTAVQRQTGSRQIDEGSGFTSAAAKRKFDERAFKLAIQHAESFNALDDKGNVIQPTTQTTAIKLPTSRIGRRGLKRQQILANVAQRQSILAQLQSRSSDRTNLNREFTRNRPGAYNLEKIATFRQQRQAIKDAAIAEQNRKISEGRTAFETIKGYPGAVYNGLYKPIQGIIKDKIDTIESDNRVRQAQFNIDMSQPMLSTLGDNNNPIITSDNLPTQYGNVAESSRAIASSVQDLQSKTSFSGLPTRKNFDAAYGLQYDDESQRPDSKLYIQKTLKKLAKVPRIKYNTGGVVPALVAGGEMVFPPNSVPMHKLHQANSGQRMLTGGELNKGQMVHSMSAGDSVPMDLPAGAFVLRASQVERSVNNATRTRFARGGQVGRQRFMNGGSGTSSNNIDFSAFTQSVGNFSESVTNMESKLTDFNTAFKATLETAITQFSEFTSSLQQLNIPTEITLTAQHTVNVVHNGAEIFSALTPEFEKYAKAIVQKAFKQYNNKNFEGGFSPLDL